jgi:GxxExxY protein
MRYTIIKNDLNMISYDIIKAAIEVHKELGPGLLESVYQRCLVIESKKMGYNITAEVPVSIKYKDEYIQEDGFRIDILVDDSIIIELKSVEKFKPVHKKQLLTYLKLADKRLGLLINFNVSLLKDGIERIVSNFQPCMDINS